jgi:serine/threonine-protein kinase
MVGLDSTAATIRVPSALAALAPGDLVAERYRVEEVIGRGAMGVVYRVEHVFMHKRFALKVLDCEWARTPGAFARFEREAIAAGTIEHPHVAHATDFGRLPDDSCFLVLEYVDGQTLRSALDRGALKPQRALTIVRGIVSAIEAAHAAGIVHRDLKPENVMLAGRDADSDYVKVLDFGIAAFDEAVAPRRSSEMLTRKGAMMGTPSYMAPELVAGESADTRTDLYAVGVILFEMLTGDLPFRGTTGSVLQQQLLQEAPPLPQSVVAAVGEPVAQIVRRLLAKEPDARFSSARELRNALDQRSSGAGDVTEAPSKPAPQPKRVASSPAAQPKREASSQLAWAGAFFGGLQARWRRRRAAGALGWSKVLGDRVRAWRRRRRWDAILAAAAKLPTRLTKWFERTRARVTRRELAMALAVATVLLLLLTAWCLGTPDDSRASSARGAAAGSPSSRSGRSTNPQQAPRPPGSSWSGRR